MPLRALLAALVVAALALTACAEGPSTRGSAVLPGEEEPLIGGSPGEVDAEAREEQVAARTTDAFSYDEMHLAADHMHTWADAIVVAMDDGEAIAGDPHNKAAQFYATLDFLLREHTMLMAFAAHAAIFERPEALDAAEDSLGSNTAELRKLLAQHFDSGVAQTFQRLWQNHVTQMINYAQAVGADDEEDRRLSREQLEEINRHLADFFADITGGLIDETVLEDHLKKHVESVATLIEQMSEDDNWYDATPPAIEVIAKVAEIIADGIASAKQFDGEVDSEAAKLLAEMSGRMADSVFFTSALTRAEVLDRDQDVDWAAALVNHNTHLIAELFRKYLGEATAQRFIELWVRHIDLFHELTEVVEERTADERVEELQDELAQWVEEFAQFLAQALGPGVSVPAMKEDAAKHVETMIRVIEAQADWLSA